MAETTVSSSVVSMGIGCCCCSEAAAAAARAIVSMEAPGVVLLDASNTFIMAASIDGVMKVPKSTDILNGSILVSSGGGGGGADGIANGLLESDVCLDEMERDEERVKGFGNEKELDNDGAKEVVVEVLLVVAGGAAPILFMYSPIQSVVVDFLIGAA